MTQAETKTRTKRSSNESDRTTAYAEAVVAGDIVAGPHVRNACRRHLLDLETAHERGLRFDLEAAQYAFDFYENVLRLSEGQFDGQKFHLQPSQAFIVGDRSSAGCRTTAPGAFAGHTSSREKATERVRSLAASGCWA